MRALRATPKAGPGQLFGLSGSGPPPSRLLKKVYEKLDLWVVLKC